MRRVRNGIVSLIGVCIITLLLSGITMAQQDKVIELTYGEPSPVDHTFSVVDKDVDGRRSKKRPTGGKIRTLLGGAITGGMDAAKEWIQGAIDMAFINPTVSKSGFQIAKESI